MSLIRRLRKWRDGCIASEAAAGEPMFVGFPDRWLADPTWACPNGHVSGRYLKSEEEGDLCLACYAPVCLVPPETTESTFPKLEPEDDPGGLPDRLHGLPTTL